MVIFGTQTLVNLLFTPYSEVMDVLSERNTVGADPETWIDRHRNEEFDNARYIVNNATNPFLALRGLALMNPEIEKLELAAIRDARALGYSWEKIAEAMMRQRQAVWKQYAALLNEPDAMESDSPE